MMSAIKAYDANAVLRAAAEDALRNTGYPAIGELECEAIDGLLLLTGELPSFYLKQIAQEAVLKLGAAEVRNLVLVICENDD